jgi:hypothetical protein
MQSRRSKSTSPFQKVKPPDYESRKRAVKESFQGLVNELPMLNTMQNTSTSGWHNTSQTTKAS